MNRSLGMLVESCKHVAKTSYRLQANLQSESLVANQILPSTTFATRQPLKYSYIIMQLNSGFNASFCLLYIIFAHVDTVVVLLGASCRMFNELRANLLD